MKGARSPCGSACARSAADDRWAEGALGGEEDGGHRGRSGQRVLCKRPRSGGTESGEGSPSALRKRQPDVRPNLDLDLDLFGLSLSSLPQETIFIRIHCIQSSFTPHGGSMNNLAMLTEGIEYNPR